MLRYHMTNGNLYFFMKIQYLFQKELVAQRIVQHVYDKHT